MGHIFIYGTLCYEPLLQLVLGADTGFSRQKATLENHQVSWVKNANYPVIYPCENAQAQGFLLTDLGAEQRARLDFYEAAFGYVLRELSVEIDGLSVPAECYFPTQSAPPGKSWSLGSSVGSSVDSSVAKWGSECWPVVRHSAGEIMGYYGVLSHRELAEKMAMIMARAASKHRGETQAAPTELRSTTPGNHVQVIDHSQPYSGFFTLQESQLRIPRFDGALSPPVQRTAFMGGDAAFVLPYDPKTDLVMVVEQFRFGAFARCDTHPWMLEPIAGRIDAGESPETCLHREAMEEAGLILNHLEPIANYYPSPGAVAEFFYSFVGLTDLSPDMAGLGGLADENEDIRSHVIDFSRLMELISTGEVASGPLVLAGLWLGLNRSRLQGLA